MVKMFIFRVSALQFQVSDLKTMTFVAAACLYVKLTFFNFNFK